MPTIEEFVPGNPEAIVELARWATACAQQLEDAQHELHGIVTGASDIDWRGQAKRKFAYLMEPTPNQMGAIASGHFRAGEALTEFGEAVGELKREATTRVGEADRADERRRTEDEAANRASVALAPIEREISGLGAVVGAIGSSAAAALTPGASEALAREAADREARRAALERAADVLRRQRDSHHRAAEAARREHGAAMARLRDLHEQWDTAQRRCEARISSAIDPALKNRSNFQKFLGDPLKDRFGGGGSVSSERRKRLRFDEVAVRAALLQARLEIPTPSLRYLDVTYAEATWVHGAAHKWEDGTEPVPADWIRRFPGLPWTVTDGRVTAQRMAERPAADQLAWWQGLGDDRRLALLLLCPAVLLGIRGLPEADTALARQHFLVLERGDLLVTSVTQTLTLEADIGVLDVEVEGSIEVQTFADGKAKVILSLEGEVGREWKKTKGPEAGIAGGLGTTLTYDFPDPAAAKAFVDGLKHAMTIADRGDALSAVGGNLAAEKAKDVVQYLGRHELAGATAAVHVEGTIGLKFGADNEVNLTGRVEGEYDFMAHETTFSGEISGHAAFASVASADASVKVAVTVDNSGHCVGMELSGSATLGGEASLKDVLESLGGKGAPLGAEVSVSGTVHFTAKIDPDDPLVQAHLHELLGAGPSAETLRALTARAQLSVDVSHSIESSVTLGKKDLDAITIAQESSTTDAHFVRPPGGDWVDEGSLMAGLR